VLRNEGDFGVAESILFLICVLLLVNLCLLLRLLRTNGVAEKVDRGNGTLCKLTSVRIYCWLCFEALQIRSSGRKLSVKVLALAQVADALLPRHEVSASLHSSNLRLKVSYSSSSGWGWSCLDWSLGSDRLALLFGVLLGKNGRVFLLSGVAGGVEGLVHLGVVARTMGAERLDEANWGLVWCKAPRSLGHVEHVGRLFGERI